MEHHYMPLLGAIYLNIMYWQGITNSDRLSGKLGVVAIFVFQIEYIHIYELVRI